METTINNTNNGGNFSVLTAQESIELFHNGFLLKNMINLGMLQNGAYLIDLNLLIILVAKDCEIGSQVGFICNYIIFAFHPNRTQVLLQYLDSRIPDKMYLPPISPGYFLPI